MTRICRFSVVLLIVCFSLAQFGCAVDRLKQPIADFAAATSVVTAQARLAYGEINRVERIRYIKTAQRLKKPIRLNELQAATTFLTGEDLATRLDALDHLDQHAKLLSQIVNSDAPDKIEASATKLETGLNGLAARIQKLSDGPVSGAGAGGGSSHPNNSKFKEKFGIFAAVTREVLGFIAKNKQNDALKRAIRDGDAPVNDLIDAIRDDLIAANALKSANLDHDMNDIFKGYNIEIARPQPDKGRLDELVKAMIENLDTQETFSAADPTEALNRLKQAHSKMVAYANQDTSDNLTEALGAIQSFVDSATRLGTAVIKLKTTTSEGS